ncbi:hypothetical protein SDRG_08453 [Saprolegnia diclina VS20]|uniref:Ferric oxidoreductase domain-containing protein n=1 Tax=Saprolegnia diclina (strain VS20) TaxID=1156394 RepID=T0QHM4_SAPDV|nr:hypothetical protein SDRG_08453 [Saprolegnia diclina VS20]EQC34251.1 hypothetical protein SDRG_08453 [Saprolegnia diclina VS20]|eukprot:XP_008612563.1 hypothetical protein SDRG_08453 [Saprolegnia diclina VS20]
MGHTSTYEAMATPPLHAPLDAEVKSVPRKLALAAHWVAGLLVLYAIFGTTVIYSQTSIDIMNNFLCPLFGVDPYKWPSGHYEMVDAGYFLFASILPIFVAFLLVRLVSHGATFPIFRVSYALQRKPRFLNSLVTYGEALFLLVVVGGNILFFYFSYTIRVEPTSTNERRLEAAAAAFGFLTAYNMAFLALPASRHCFWMEWLGIPYAHGIKYHRWLGILSILALVLHTIVYVVSTG